MPRSRTPGAPPALHELEAEIMEEVWREDGGTTVKLVMEALNRKAKPPRAHTMYMTVMRRLADKGLLSRKRSGVTTPTRCGSRASNIRSVAPALRSPGW